MRRDSLPSNARRRPSQTMHFGAQSRGLRAPCERFAPWVTPGPRITRFRLAADLGRMGLDTHRVSNKVSKITSRHLVPLDRAFPAHALMHGSTGNQHPPPLVPRSVHSITLGHSQGRHAVQDLAAHSGFHPLTLQRSGPDHRTDDGLVPTHRGVGQTSLAVAGPGVPAGARTVRSIKSFNPG